MRGELCIKWTGFRSGCVGGGPRRAVFVPGGSLYARVGDVCRCEAFSAIVKAARGEEAGGKIAVFAIVLGSWA